MGDLHLLPEGLRLEDAKTKITVKGLAFQGKHSIFSNFYPAPVRYNGKLYPTTEHAYQWDRATYLGNNYLANQIYLAPSPEAAKHHVRRLGVVKVWNDVKVDRMTQIALVKFRQNPRLKAELMKTVPLALIEASYDSFWGSGYPLTTRNLASGNWNGKNHLGQILFNCRVELNREDHARMLQGGANSCNAPAPQPMEAQSQRIQARSNTGVTEIKSTQPSQPSYSGSTQIPQLQTSYQQSLQMDVSCPPPLVNNQPVTGRQFTGPQQPPYPNQMNMGNPPYSPFPYSQSQYQVFPTSSQPFAPTQSQNCFSQPFISSQGQTVTYLPTPSSVESFTHGTRNFGYDPSLSPLYVT